MTNSTVECPRSSSGSHHWAVLWDDDEKRERERCLACGIFNNGG